MVRVHTGRKKIKMVKMNNPLNLQVTFSKRRYGLYKKATELSILCGVDMALIVFSPTCKVFSFGHPNINTVLDRFSRSTEDYPLSYISNIENSESINDSNLQYLNAMLIKVSADIEEQKAQKQRNKMMRNEMLQKHLEHWYMNSPEEFNLTQAIQMKHAVEEFMKSFDDHNPQSNPTIINHQDFEVGSSSNVARGTTTIVHHDGNIYNNQDSIFDQMRMITSNYGPNMIMNHGYNHDQVQNHDQ